MPESKVLHPPSDDLLTAEQVALATGFSSIDALYQNRHRRLLPGTLGVRYRGRLWWRRADLEAYLNEALTESFDKAWKNRHSEPVITEARRLANEAKKANGA